VDRQPEGRAAVDLAPQAQPAAEVAHAQETIPFLGHAFQRRPLVQPAGSVDRDLDGGTQQAAALDLLDMQEEDRFAGPGRLVGLLAGAVFIETVFQWPGMGLLFITAVTGRDAPVIVAVGLLLTVGVLVANLLTDLAYTIADPRVRIG
jgi:hypothetical protein